MERCRGQQMSEFTVLMGLVVGAAIAVQALGRNAISNGIGEVTSVVLGVPTDDNNAPTEFNLTARQEVQEGGRAERRHGTRTQEHVTGHSVNEDVQTDVFDE